MFRINSRIIFISIYIYGISCSLSSSFNYTSQTLYYQYSRNSFKKEDISRNLLSCTFALLLASAWKHSDFGAPNFIFLMGSTFSKLILRKKTQLHRKPRYVHAKATCCLCLQTFDSWQPQDHGFPWRIFSCKLLLVLLTKYCRLPWSSNSRVFFFKIWGQFWPLQRFLHF